MSLTRLLPIRQERWDSFESGVPQTISINQIRENHRLFSPGNTKRSSAKLTILLGKMAVKENLCVFGK
jgi:hypothetical protein